MFLPFSPLTETIPPPSRGDWGSFDPSVRWFRDQKQWRINNYFFSCDLALCSLSLWGQRITSVRAKEGSESTWLGTGCRTIFPETDGHRLWNHTLQIILAQWMGKAAQGPWCWPRCWTASIFHLPKPAEPPWSISSFTIGNHWKQPY